MDITNVRIHARATRAQINAACCAKRIMNPFNDKLQQFEYVHENVEMTTELINRFSVFFQKKEGKSE